MEKTPHNDSVLNELNIERELMAKVALQHFQLGMWYVKMSVY